MAQTQTSTRVDCMTDSQVPGSSLYSLLIIFLSWASDPSFSEVTDRATDRIPYVKYVQNPVLFPLLPSLLLLLLLPPFERPFLFYYEDFSIGFRKFLEIYKYNPNLYSNSLYNYIRYVKTKKDLI